MQSSLRSQRSLSPDLISPPRWEFFFSKIYKNIFELICFPKYLLNFKLNNQNCNSFPVLIPRWAGAEKTATIPLSEANIALPARSGQFDSCIIVFKIF